MNRTALALFILFTSISVFAQEDFAELSSKERIKIAEKEEIEAKRDNVFQEMMQKHIRKNFRYPEIAQEMGVQGRVNVIFVIQRDGSIGDIRMRGPDKNLEAEALRIIKKLPKMTPGKQRGRPVKVPFSIPITFKLQ